MRLPFINKLGINLETGAILAVAGLAGLYLIHSMGTSDVPVNIPTSNSIGPEQIYGDEKGFNVQRIGWSIPTSTEAKSDVYGSGTRATRKGWPAVDAIERTGFEVPHTALTMPPPGNDIKRMVANSGYNPYDSASRKDGTAYYAGAYATTPCVQNAMCMQDYHWDATQCKCVENSTSTTDPAVLDLQDRILKIIVRRTNNVTTILSNLETIKAEIQTYTAKLQLAIDQTKSGLLNQAQLAQYLESIVTEITTKLKISINPAYGDNTVPDYYQQYYQDYQKYTNQLNSNYYDYYQPSYQYYPGQQYNYYQPYQYQYPSPYYPSGQYPTNYPYYNYGSGSSSSNSYSPYYDYYNNYYRRNRSNNNSMINIGPNGIQMPGINIGTGGSGGGLLGGIFG